MEKIYELPSIVWLKVTDYMHGWIQYELGGAARVKSQRVVCVQHLPGARRILRMETVNDMEMKPAKISNSMSDRRKNMLAAGMDIDGVTIEKEYGMTPEAMKLFMPVECPKLCLTKNGVLRPWTLDVNLGQQQAGEMQRLLRETFWEAVQEFDADYARKMNGEKYPAVDMIEEFCTKTETPDIYVETIRREWQRRLKSGKSRHLQPGENMTYCR